MQSRSDDLEPVILLRQALNGGSQDIQFLIGSFSETVIFLVILNDIFQLSRNDFRHGQSFGFIQQIPPAKHHINVPRGPDHLTNFAFFSETAEINTQSSAKDRLNLFSSAGDCQLAQLP